ncbi:MAG: hypothetical protein ABSF41_18255 [Pseudolabrys sp.]
MVRGAERYQLCDPARFMPAAQIFARRETTHAVPNDCNLIRPCLRAQRFDPRVQLIGKAVDAPERRFEADGSDGNASGLQFAAQPPPSAPIAQIAVDQQDRNNVRRLAPHIVFTHPQPLERLNENEQSLIGQPFADDGAPHRWTHEVRRRRGGINAGYCEADDNGAGMQREKNADRAGGGCQRARGTGAHEQHAGRDQYRGLGREAAAEPERYHGSLPLALTGPEAFLMNVQKQGLKPRLTS